MLKTKPYKKTSKANMKRRRERVDDAGDVAISNAQNASSKRLPVIALPEIKPLPIMQIQRRFVNNGTAANAGLTIFNLLDQFTMAISATSLVPFVRLLRIKRIRILAPVTTQGTSVTVSISPNAVDSAQNNYNSCGELYLDTSASIDVPAYLSLTPSLETPLGSWHYFINIDSSLASINAPAGSTLDILFECILHGAGPSPASHTRVVAGATIGNVYASSIVGGAFVPSGMTTI